MGTRADIRAGLKARLATIAGLGAESYVRDVADVPVAMVGFPETGFDKTFGRGSDDYEVPIMVFASRVTDDDGQEQLDAYMDPSGPKSIKAAIEAEETLGGVADFAWVKETRESGPYEFSGVTYLGGVLLVQITVSP